MKISLPKSMKAKIKEERADVFEQMRGRDVSTTEWDQLNRKYEAYTKMLPTCKISPDTVAVVVGNIAVAAMVLNWESLGNLARSKALSFLLKARV